MELIEMLAKACHYAQDHIDDPCAWSIREDEREVLLQCTSYQIACFIAQNTEYGRHGVDWDVVIQELAEHPAKTEYHWRLILERVVEEYGGWKE